MEIRTCEQYVLEKLNSAEEELEYLRKISQEYELLKCNYKLLLSIVQTNATITKFNTIEFTPVCKENDEIEYLTLEQYLNEDISW